MTMGYASGETPLVGDYIKNKWQQPGTVTSVQAAEVGPEDIDIKWDDSGTDLLSLLQDGPNFERIILPRSRVKASFEGCERRSRQAKVLQRRASESAADIRLDDQFQHSNV
jgi:hypothetical protein